MWKKNPLASEQEQLKALQRLDTQKVIKFIQKGMDVNKEFSETGKRPIHYAISYTGRTQLLEYLLQVPGIEIDAFDTCGNTALMYAAYRGYIDACCLLIRYGASYTLKSKLDGKNALEIFREESPYKSLFYRLETAIKEREAMVSLETPDEKSLPVTGHATEVIYRKPNRPKIIAPTSQPTLQKYPASSCSKALFTCISFWNRLTSKSKKEANSTDVELITPSTPTPGLSKTSHTD